MQESRPRETRAASPGGIVRCRPSTSESACRTTPTSSSNSPSTTRCSGPTSWATSTRCWPASSMPLSTEISGSSPSSTGTVSGAAYYAPEPFADRMWNLYSLATAPARHGAGLGSVLMDRVQGDLRTAGDGVARTLIVDTSGLDGFEGARRFSGSQGFVEEARVRDFYGPGDHKVTFWKSLVDGRHVRGCTSTRPNRQVVLPSQLPAFRPRWSSWRSGMTAVNGPTRRRRTEPRDRRPRPGSTHGHWSENRVRCRTRLLTVR